MDNKEVKDKTLNDFILDLKIISKIKPFDKVCVDNDTIRIDNSYIQPIKRYIYNNSRLTTIEYLENLDKNLTIEIEKYINEILLKVTQVTQVMKVMIVTIVT